MDYYVSQLKHFNYLGIEFPCTSIQLHDYVHVLNNSILYLVSYFKCCIFCPLVLFPRALMSVFRRFNSSHSHCYYSYCSYYSHLLFFKIYFIEMRTVKCTSLTYCSMNFGMCIQSGNRYPNVDIKHCH